jgi:hypothetical protein
MATPSTLTRNDSDGVPAVRVHASVRRSLAAYATLGASASAMPLPLLPDALLRRVRGALVHDVATRHGLSLTPDARDALSEPTGAQGARGLASQALRYFGVRLAVRMLVRFGPIALVWPLRDGLRTYVLGHLFDRYLERLRTDRAVRIHLEEARRVRRAIDGALMRAIAPAMTVQPSSPDEPVAIDDQRSAVTALVDGAIDVVASLPDKLMRSLDGAFDDLLIQPHG